MNWLKKTLSSSLSGNPSTKRLVVLLAASALAICLLTLCISCAHWIWKHGDLGNGGVMVLIGISGAVAGLAGTAYRKREERTSS